MSMDVFKTISPYIAVLCLISLITLQTFASDSERSSAKSIAESLETNPETRLFAGALKASKFWNTLAEDKQVTVFIPGDDALRDEGSAFLLDVVLLKPANSQRLNNLIAQHVFPGLNLDNTDLSRSSRYANAHGDCVSIDTTDRQSIRVGSEAAVADIANFSNGRVYYIDRLLWQPFENPGSCNK